MTPERKPLVEAFAVPLKPPPAKLFACLVAWEGGLAMRPVAFSIEALCELLNASESTVHRAIKRAVDSGCVSVEKRPGQPSLYRWVGVSNSPGEGCQKRRGWGVKNDTPSLFPLSLEKRKRKERGGAQASIPSRRVENSTPQRVDPARQRALNLSGLRLARGALPDPRAARRAGGAK